METPAVEPEVTEPGPKIRNTTGKHYWKLNGPRVTWEKHVLQQLRACGGQPLVFAVQSRQVARAEARLWRKKGLTVETTKADGRWLVQLSDPTLRMRAAGGAPCAR